MKKVLVSLVFVIAIALAGCAAADGVTVTDMAGREVTLEAPADKVVVLMPADAEILFALGAGDTVVGCGTYCATPEELAVMPDLANVTVVNSGYVINIEQILALEPQLVIMTTMDQTKEHVDALAAGGVQVAVTDAQDLAGVYQAIELIGALTGRDAEAAALTESMRSRFAEISALAGETGKTLYVEESPLQWGLWAAGNHTYMNDLAKICGLTNIFEDLEGHKSVSEEQVIERNPDVIITMSMYDAPDEEIKNRAGWENVSAVQSGAVIYDPTNAVALPGPRLVDVAEMLLELAMPEALAPAA